MEDVFGSCVLECGVEVAVATFFPAAARSPSCQEPTAVQSNIESVLHSSLKGVALGLLRRAGCCAYAAEVRCPIARYRADAAGYLDAASKRNRTAAGGGTEQPMGFVLPRLPLASTVIIEVKVSRADYQRDAAHAAMVAAKLAALQDRHAHLVREFITPLEPHLRRSSTMLFAELEPWDYDASTLNSSKLLGAAIATLTRHCREHTKLAMASRYHLANWLLILSPKGVLSPSELPMGWGLLEFDQATGSVSVAAPAVLHAPPPRFTQRLLRNIASSASRAAATERNP